MAPKIRRLGNRNSPGEIKDAARTGLSGLFINGARRCYSSHGARAPARRDDIIFHALALIRERAASFSDYTRCRGKQRVPRVHVYLYARASAKVRAWLDYYLPGARVLICQLRGDELGPCCLPRPRGVVSFVDVTSWACVGSFC